MLPNPTSILARYPPAFRPTTAPEPLGNAGGLSGARLWRYGSPLGTLVARAWPTNGPGREAIERIHRWLEEAKPVGFVPVPLPGIDGRTLQDDGGGLWEVAPWMDGTPDLERPPGLGRLRAGFSGLAAFHRRFAQDRSRGTSPGLSDRLDEIVALERDEFAAMGRVLDHAEADPRRDQARRWLVLARRMAPRIRVSIQSAAAIDVWRQPCLRDARPEHFLFRGDRLTGLVDFGAMGIESVAADLARLLSEWVGDDRSARAEALDAYARARDLDVETTRLIDPFESSSALLGAGRWVRWHFIDKRTFDPPSAVLAGLRRGVERLERLARG